MAGTAQLAQALLNAHSKAPPLLMNVGLGYPARFSRLAIIDHDAGRRFPGWIWPNRYPRRSRYEVRQNTYRRRWFVVGRLAWPCVADGSGREESGDTRFRDAHLLRQSRQDDRPACPLSRS